MGWWRGAGERGWSPAPPDVGDREAQCPQRAWLRRSCHSSLTVGTCRGEGTVTGTQSSTGLWAPVQLALSSSLAVTGAGEVTATVPGVLEGCVMSEGASWGNLGCPEPQPLPPHILREPAVGWWSQQSRRRGTILLWGAAAPQEMLLWELCFDLYLLLFLPLIKVPSNQSVTMCSVEPTAPRELTNSKGTCHSPTVRSMLCLSPSARSRYKHPLW